MFNDMDQLVVSQEPAVERTEESAEQALENVSKGNVEVGKAIKRPRNGNKLK
jgi:t-SNARE complex subunit (syntaxin)